MFIPNVITVLCNFTTVHTCRLESRQLCYYMKNVTNSRLPVPKFKEKWSINLKYCLLLSMQNYGAVKGNLKTDTSTCHFDHFSFLFQEFHLYLVNDRLTYNWDHFWHGIQQVKYFTPINRLLMRAQLQKTATAQVTLFFF